MGLKFTFALGQPDSPKVREKIARFARVATTINHMRHSRIGLLGYTSMGMYTGTFDHLAVRQRLGPEIDQLDQYAILRKLDTIDGDMVASLVSKAREEWEISSAVSDGDLETVARMYAAMRALVDEHKWDAVAIKCQYELSQMFGMAPCVPLSMLGNELPCSCEGDVPLILTQMMLHELTDGVVTYTDVHDVWEHSVIIGACGYAPFALSRGKPKVNKHTAIYQGLSNSTVYRGGRVTMSRLALRRQGNYKLHLVTGTADVPPVFHEVDCQTYPSMEVTIDGNAESFTQHLMSQHYAVVYAEAAADMRELCRLLDIDVVED
jgi:L-fucose isomerase-like protein